MTEADFDSFNNSSTFEENQLAERFLSYVFHEIRTPITIVHSYAQITFEKLPAEPKYDDLRRLMQRMVSKSDETVEMIEELLDATRIPLRRLSLDVTETKVTTLLEEVIELLPEEIGTRLELRLENTASEAHLRADPSRLQRTIYNLLIFLHQTQLAWQLSPDLIISCGVEAVADQLTLEISMPGFMLDKTEQQNLFDMHRAVRQAETHRSHVKAGLLDLNLYLAYSTTVAQGGKLEYDGNLPGFHLELPLVTPDGEHY